MERLMERLLKRVLKRVLKKAPGRMPGRMPVLVHLFLDQERRIGERVWWRHRGSLYQDRPSFGAR